MALIPELSSALDFGEENNLNSSLNSFVEFDNQEGFVSLGVKVIIPSGGKVLIEGSFDGVSFSPITFRSLDDDEYEQEIDHDQNLIGSINTLRKIRFRVISAGSSNGTIIGRASRILSILEGIEHSNAPHNQGFIPIRKNFHFTGQQTNSIIWTPTSDKKYIITDFIINLYNPSVTATTVEIFDETNSSGNWLYKGTIAAGTTEHIVSNFKFPFVSSVIDNELKLTTSNGITVSGVLHGYEVF